MVDIKNGIILVNIEDELQQSYLDYAMSVIVGRALPDVRDGLKPVHRRSLFAMGELNNDWNKPYKKSARVVGDVIGKYHPHGDTAVYDTIVRMAQDFSMRYMLIDGQGNFGSVDGDAAAAMRYTEIRMNKIAHELMADLDKETVNFVPNYDGTEQIPEVLPTKIPNLLVNGSAGIAVGMATNIPPHNLKEVIEACLVLIDTPETNIDQLMEIIPGPDFPTGATINGRAGILSAYRTGKGRIYIRATAEVVDKQNRQQIIISELPYQVNKARLIEKIAELVKEKKIEGISEIRDESDKDGMRVVIELRRGELGDVVLNNLYAQTQLENVFGINMVALVDGQPQLLNLKQVLEAFIRHRREVVTRRTVFELRKARQRGHILEGLAVALSNIDPVIQTIKKSASSQEAQQQLLNQSWGAGYVLEMLKGEDQNACRPDDLPENYGIKDEVYYFSPEQAKAILEMRLHRLTGLEHEKLITEYKELLVRIVELALILSDSEKLLEVIRTELRGVSEEFGDNRRTEIMSSRRDLTVEDLISEQDMVVTISHSGYAKTTPLSEYQAQRRGGRGKAAASLKEEDFVEHMLVASTHTQILLFSSRGKVYWMKVYQIPEAGRTSRGRPVVNLLPLEENEKITAMLPVEEYTDGHYIFMATRKATVKKVPLSQFARPRSIGLIALDLNEDDTLVGAAITNGENEVMLLSNTGKAIRFNETAVRGMGRQARGVRGMRLAENQHVISLIIPDDNAEILTVSQAGYGKRSPVIDFRLTGRGGQGVIAMQCNERNGVLVGAVQVKENEEIMLISNRGTLVRTRVNEVRVMGRNTQGVRLIRLGTEEDLVRVERILEPVADDDTIDDNTTDGNVTGDDPAGDNPTDNDTADSGTMESSSEAIQSGGDVSNNVGEGEVDDNGVDDDENNHELPDE